MSNHFDYYISCHEQIYKYFSWKFEMLSLEFHILLDIAQKYNNALLFITYYIITFHYKSYYLFKDHGKCWEDYPLCKAVK